MPDASVKFDLGEFERYLSRIKKAAAGDFKKDLSLFLEGLGYEFLRILQEEIVKVGSVDTRLLLKSFHKRGKENVWVLSKGSLTLEVGTNVEYASWVNDGHWTNPRGVESRFVPGYLISDAGGKKKFVYQKGAKTGILLRQKWVEGKHFWEDALYILEKMYPKLLEAKLDDWLKTYFADFL